MAKCIYCGARYDDQMTEARCGICGSFLPGRDPSPSAPQPKASTVTVAESDASAPPVGNDDEAEPSPEQLIRPRKLSPEFERHVTAAWDATCADKNDPQETLNERSGSQADPENLLINPRSVGNIEDEQPADYELKEEVGQGNMGTVYSARQSSMDRTVAIKVPKSTTAGSSLGRSQFISEVVVTGQLDHPNIVPIYDLGRDARGELFYSMKLVEGCAWNECMHDGSFSREENVEILMKVCDAIRFAHDRGVIHRDIKPHNIMIGKYGEVSVMDWGIALRLETEPGDQRIAKLSPAGTPAYMAPEMAGLSTGDLGPHTDVYLLGAVLYELLTGRPPHPVQSDLKGALIAAAMNDIQPAEQGGELIDIAYKAMATNTENRYPTVKEFQDAIRDYRSHAESILLAERGREHFERARQNGNASSGGEGDRFDEYDRARFAFEESVKLWPANRAAQEGLAETLLDYARYAYNEGAYARGIALLDADNPAHAAPLRKLHAARRRTNRAAALLKAAVAVILIGGLAFSSFSWWQWRIAENARQDAVEAEVKQAELAKSEKKAKERQTELKIAAETAAENEKRAKEKQIELKLAAETAAGNEKRAKERQIELKLAAEAAADNERFAKQEAERASYAFEIGLASEELQRNAFDRAGDILREQADNIIKAPLRDWEWAHLSYLANKRPVEQFGPRKSARLQHRVEASAISDDGQWIAAGTKDGFVYVWARDQSRRPIQLKYGSSVQAVAISGDRRDGALVAAAGMDDSPAAGRHRVKIWSLPTKSGSEPIAEIATHEAPLFSVAFSLDSATLLTSAADGTARLWRVDNGRELQAFRGHLADEVYSARFSTNGQSIVTAGEDGTVRVWSAATGDEIRRFEGHDGPVYTAAFSPNGQQVVSGGSDRRLLVWELSEEDGRFAATVRAGRVQEIRDRLQGDKAPRWRRQLEPFGAHDAAIRSICFARDGNFVVSAADDNTVRVWDLSQGIDNAELRKTLRGHGGWVRSCAITDDGDRILSAGYDGRVTLWDWQKYQVPLVLASASERADIALQAAAYSPDGRWIATATNHDVTVWNMEKPTNPRPQRLSEGHGWLTTTGIFFSGGNRLLTAAGDNTARIWDVKQGNQLLQIGGGWDHPDGTGFRGVAAVAHEGRWIATGSTDPGKALARIWDAETGALRRNVGGGDRSATALAVSLDDQLLFVGDDRGGCNLFDVSSGDLIRTLAGHADKVSAASFLPGGRFLLTASADGTLARWDVQAATTQPINRILDGGRIVAMDVSADGQHAVTASSSGDAGLRLWNLATNEVGVFLPLQRIKDQYRASSNGGESVDNPLVIRAVELGPLGDHALVTLFFKDDSRYRLGRWDWSETSRPFRDISRGLRGLHEVSMAVYVPGKARTILTVGGKGPRQQSLAGVQIMSYRPQIGIQSASFSADSQRLACASADGSLKLWRLDSDSQQWLPQRKLVDRGGRALRTAVFHPTDNDLLLTGGEDGTVRFWSATKGDEGDSIAHLEGPVAAAIFSPDGSRVLTASANEPARLWEAATGKLLGSLDDPDDEAASIVQCVAFTPDGKWIITGSGSTATIWDVEARTPLQNSDEEVVRLKGHSADLTSIAVSPDGNRVLTASKDFSVKLWDTSALASLEGLELKGDIKELLTLEEHSNEVIAVMFSPDVAHPFVLTAGRDGEAILWPAEPIK